MKNPSGSLSTRILHGGLPSDFCTFVTSFRWIPISWIFEGIGMLSKLVACLSTPLGTMKNGFSSYTWDCFHHPKLPSFLPFFQSISFVFLTRKNSYFTHLIPNFYGIIVKGLTWYFPCDYEPVILVMEVYFSCLPNNPILVQPIKVAVNLVGIGKRVPVKQLFLRRGKCSSHFSV